MYSTTVDPDCNLKLPNYLPAIHVSRLPSETDRLIVEKAVSAKVRLLIEQTRERYSGHCLQLSICYERPREIRLNTLIERKEAILVMEDGETYVGPPMIRPRRSSYQTEENVTRAVAKIMTELDRGRQSINERKTGWAHIYAHFGDFRLTGLRLAIDIKV
jgi:hypothetical protein